MLICLHMLPMIPTPHQPDQENHSIIRRVYDLTLNELRHSTVFEAIKRSQKRRVLDVGCNTGDFIKLLSRSSQLQLIVGMDCDDQILPKAVNNAHPELVQSSIQFDRENDLIVKVYKGDLTKQYQQLKNLQFQVITMIEVIEHLPPEVITEANQMLFGFLKTPIIIITTPNKEFNAHFSSDPDRLRHWDHKFQWKRHQFEAYCSSVGQKYGYSYELSGIGEHVNDPSLGCCTQMATFSLINTQKSSQATLDPLEIMKQQKTENKPQLKVEHTILCWSSKLNEIVLGLFYNCVANQTEKTFEELLQYIKTMSILSRSLQKKNIELNIAFLTAFVKEFSSQFEWNQTKFWRKQAQNEPLQPQQLAYERQLEEYLANSPYLYFSDCNNEESCSVNSQSSHSLG